MFRFFKEVIFTVLLVSGRVTAKFSRNVFRKKITRILVEVKFFSVKQFGFTRKPSRVNAVAEAISLARKTNCKRQCGLGAFIDLKKKVQNTGSPFILRRLGLYGQSGKIKTLLKKEIFRLEIDSHRLEGWMLNLRPNEDYLLQCASRINFAYAFLSFMFTRPV